MYIECLKRISSTERGLRVAFSSGRSERSMELSPEAAGQLLRALQAKANEEPLTLKVLGHQVVRSPEAYGLLIRTQELGELVFSLPQAILERLIRDLTHLASSPPAVQDSSKIAARRADRREPI